MNSVTLKALMLDAFYQVLDNKAFRVLLVLELVLVGFFFVVGFRETNVQVFWGVWEFDYASAFAAIGQRFAPTADLQGVAVQMVQSLIIDTLCGSIGMIVCVAATAFFIPAMLEKGAADIVFSKPVSRLALMMSRYVSGLLFVGMLALIGVAGMWLGLVVVSGYNDFGFLWGMLTLLYLFAILHSFSVVVGVLTRSTIATILISVVFYMGTGCEHGIWLGKSYFKELNSGAAMRTQLEKADIDEAAKVKADEQAGSPVLDALGFVIDGLHLVLPKTSDADVLTRKLRKAVAREAWRISDDTASLSIEQVPEGMKVIEPEDGRLTIDLEHQPLVFGVRGADGADAARIEFTRRPREFEQKDANGKTRMRRLSTAQAAEEVMKRVRDSGAVIGDVTSERTEVDGTYAMLVHWNEAKLERSVHVLTFGDWVIEISAGFAPNWPDTSVSVSVDNGPRDRAPRTATEEHSRRLRSFLEHVHFARQAGLTSPKEWYDKRFQWDGPISSNIGFSLASSFLFIALMLGLAWWKLERIDF